MFHSRKLNNRINQIHEKALRIVYQDNVSLFQELLEKDKSVSIHQRNLQALAIEVFKVKIGTAPKILVELFNCRSNNYSLRNPSDFDRVNKNTVKFGENSLTYLAPIIWDQVPKETNLCNNLNQFKKFYFSRLPLQIMQDLHPGSWIFIIFPLKKLVKTQCFYSSFLRYDGSYC